MALVKVTDQKEGATTYGNTGVKKDSGYDVSNKTGTNTQKRTTTSKPSTEFTNLGGQDLGNIAASYTGVTGNPGVSDNSLDIYSLYSNYLAQQRAAAEASYRRNIEAINNAYGSAKSYYDSNLQSTKNTLKASYDASKTDINADAEASLREAYINNMLNRKNLNQALTAQGLNGGASESTQASMLNQYGNARNTIETQEAKNLADLLRTYNDNLSSAQNAWSSQMANLELQKMAQLQQAENALNSMQTASLGNISTDSSYLTALQSLMKAQNAYELAPTTNNLLQSLTNTTQANEQDIANTNWQKYLEQQALQQEAERQAMVTALQSQNANQRARLYAL